MSDTCPVLQAAEACGTLEIDSALDTVGSLGRDLEAYEKSAEDGKLLPLPGDTVSCQKRIQNIHRLKEINK